MADDGQQDAERYRVLGELGRGGAARVERVFDRRLQRVVARKVGRAKAAEIEREARLIAHLDHPGVVPVYDTEGGAAYTMRVVDGDPLGDVLARHPAGLPIGEALRTLRAVCATVHAAHQRGVLHLDLKPANVVLGPNGEVTVVDWGIAHVYDADRFQARYAREGLHVEAAACVRPLTHRAGSLPYMPLEQIDGDRDLLGPAADVFAAGVLLYVMLSGRLPYPTAADVADRAHLLRSHVPLPVDALRGDVPGRVADLCAAMIRAPLDERVPSMAVVLDHLRELAAFGRDFETRVYEPGAVLVRQGELGDVALQILDGRVAVEVHTAHGAERVAVRVTGDVVGEIAVFTGAPRMATLRALQRTTVRVIDRHTIDGELAKLDPLIVRMLRGLTERFLDTTRD